MRIVPMLSAIILASAGWLSAADHDPAPSHATEANASHSTSPSTGHDAPKGPSADEALALLLDGNKRFVSCQTSTKNKDVKRRMEVAKGQAPMAIVVCCSDSRVPPEQVFDVGLGDIFVVRLAGNIVDSLAMGSIEYAVEHLHSPLIIVLGHERCGAVTASVSGGEAPPGHILAVVEAIQNNLRGSNYESVDHAVRLNAQAVSQQIASSEPIVSKATKSGHVKVVAMRYDLDDGTAGLLK